LLYIHYVIFSLGTLSSQNHEWTAWVCYKELGVWCYFVIPLLDSLSCPLYFEGGEMEKCQKCDGALIWRVIMTKQLNIVKPKNKPTHEG